MLTDTADLPDISALPDADLVDAIRTARHRLIRVQAGFIIALVEFHDRDLARSQEAPNTVVWLNRRHDLARRTAYDYLRTGRYLRAHHQLAAEFAAGKLSYSRVRLLWSYLTAENEDELVDLALELTDEDLKQALNGRPRPGGQEEAVQFLHHRPRRRDRGIEILGQSRRRAQRGTDGRPETRGAVLPP